MCNIDLEKAFDKLKREREKIWNSLNKREIPQKIILAVKSLYSNRKQKESTLGRE